MADPGFKAKSADIPPPSFRFSIPVWDTKAPQTERTHPQTSCQPPACRGNVQYLPRAQAHTVPAPNPSSWWRKSMGPRECAPLDPASAFPTSGLVWVPRSSECPEQTAEPPSRACTGCSRLVCPTLHHSGLLHTLTTRGTVRPGPGAGEAGGGRQSLGVQTEAFPGAAQSPGQEGRGPGAPFILMPLVPQMLGTGLAPLRDWKVSLLPQGWPAPMLGADGLNTRAAGEGGDSCNVKGSLALGSKFFLHEMSSALCCLRSALAKPPAGLWESMGQGLRSCGLALPLKEAGIASEWARPPLPACSAVLLVHYPRARVLAILDESWHF